MNRNEAAARLLEEHVIDRDGLIWRVVRDGGMATCADYSGITSIGIEALRMASGPLVTVADRIAAERRAAWKRADWILKGYRFDAEVVIWHDLRRAILDEEAAR